MITRKKVVNKFSASMDGEHSQLAEENTSMYPDEADDVVSLKQSVKNLSIGGEGVSCFFLKRNCSPKKLRKGTMGDFLNFLQRHSETFLVVNDTTYLRETYISQMENFLADSTVEYFVKILLKFGWMYLKELENYIVNDPSSKEYFRQIEIDSVNSEQLKLFFMNNTATFTMDLKDRVFLKRYLGLSDDPSNFLALNFVRHDIQTDAKHGDQNATQPCQVSQLASGKSLLFINSNNEESKTTDGSNSGNESKPSACRPKTNVTAATNRQCHISHGDEVAMAAYFNRILLRFGGKATFQTLKNHAYEDPFTRGEAVERFVTKLRTGKSDANLTALVATYTNIFSVKKRVVSLRKYVRTEADTAAIMYFSMLLTTTDIRAYSLEELRNVCRAESRKNIKRFSNMCSDEFMLFFEQNLDVFSVTLCSQRICLNMHNSCLKSQHNDFLLNDFKVFKNFDKFKNQYVKNEEITESPLNLKPEEAADKKDQATLDVPQTSFEDSVVAFYGRILLKHPEGLSFRELMSHQMNNDHPVSAKQRKRIQKMGINKGQEAFFKFCKNHSDTFRFSGNKVFLAEYVPKDFDIEVINYLTMLLAASQNKMTLKKLKLSVHPDIPRSETVLHFCRSGFNRMLLFLEHYPELFLVETKPVSGVKSLGDIIVSLKSLARTKPAPEDVWVMPEKVSQMMLANVVAYYSRILLSCGGNASCSKLCNFYRGDGTCNEKIKTLICKLELDKIMKFKSFCQQQSDAFNIDGDSVFLKEYIPTKF